MTVNYYINLILGQIHTQQSSSKILLGLSFWKLKLNSGRREIDNHIRGDR